MAGRAQSKDLAWGSHRGDPAFGSVSKVRICLKNKERPTRGRSPNGNNRRSQLRWPTSRQSAPHRTAVQGKRILACE
jgi:hypothetical protein